MKWIALIAGLAGMSFAAHAASFQNLGFDSANTNRVVFDPGPVARGTGPVEDLLPFWQFAKGGASQTTLGLNLTPLTLGTATLITSDQSDYYRFNVEGPYALYLIGSPGNQEPFSLTQRGEIPAAARWLSYHYSGAVFDLTINGLNLRPVQHSADREVFDISAFSGQTVDLTLTMDGPLMPTQSASSFLDSIAFTIPEPQTWLLLSLGLSAWLAVTCGTRLRARCRSSIAASRH